MTPTRIAGLSFNDRNARQVQRTAQIYSYARRIRRLAHDAAALPEAVSIGEPTQVDVWRRPVGGELRRP